MTLDRSPAPNLGTESVLQGEWTNQALQMVDRLGVALKPANCVLSNAIKFSHTGGTVTINVTRVGEEILPKMIDADVGMEPGKLARLRAGHLVESTEGTEHKAGSGLGLAICRDILETHGRRLQLESEPGRDGNERLSLEIDPVDRADRRIARWR